MSAVVLKSYESVQDDASDGSIHGDTEFMFDIESAEISSSSEDDDFSKSQLTKPGMETWRWCYC